MNHFVKIEYGTPDGHGGTFIGRRVELSAPSPVQSRDAAQALLDAYMHGTRSATVIRFEPFSA